MISIKNKAAMRKMETAGQRLAEIFQEIKPLIVAGITTLELDAFIEKRMTEKELASKCKGYMGYKHVSCISVNDEVVHGVPHVELVLKDGDLVKVDVVASYKGYCADMARCFFVGDKIVDPIHKKLVEVAQASLDKGIAMAVVGNRISDISAAVQKEVEKHGFGVVRDFAGHGIGKQMHEDPEIVNYGEPGKGPVIRAGMSFAIEPMITQGSYEVYVTDDKWTAKTADESWAAHVEDTVIVTVQGPKIITRLSESQEGVV